MVHTHSLSRDRPPDPSRRPRLERGQLHEIHADADGWASALAFGLTAIEGDAHRPVLLLRVRPGRSGVIAMEPYGAGWAPLGIDPARLVIVDAKNDAGLLRAGLDAARVAGSAAVIMESWGHLREYDLVASRRLILAAEQSGLAIVMLRGDARPRASAAHTRWQVSSAPSTPLEMRAPGHAALLVELQRRRGGPAGMAWRLEWNEDNACFDEHPVALSDARPDDPAPLSGTVVSLAGVRAGEPLRRSA